MGLDESSYTVLDDMTGLPLSTNVTPSAAGKPKDSPGIEKENCMSL